jgi:hypothetical protein
MTTKKSRRRRPAETPGSAPGVRMSLCLPHESYAQLEELASRLHISRTAVIAQAVARWHHDEPLVKANGERKPATDGSYRPVLQRQ